MHVDAGEHLGVGGSAFAAQLHRTTRNLVPPALQDQHHVISGAAACPCQQQFHRASRHVLTALIGLVGVRRSIHGHHMAAAGFGHKAHGRARAARAGPTDGAFHLFLLGCCLGDIVSATNIALHQFSGYHFHHALIQSTFCLLHPLKRWIHSPAMQVAGLFFGRVTCGTMALSQRSARSLPPSRQPQSPP